MHFLYFQAYIVSPLKITTVLLVYIDMAGELVDFLKSRSTMTLTNVSIR